MNPNLPPNHQDIDDIREYSEEVYEMAKVFGIGLEEADRELQQHWEEWSKLDAEEI